MSEEEVMRKRLTVEGDGGNDDKRIMSLVKTFVRWVQSTSLTEEEIDATYQKMLFTLGRSKLFACMLSVPVTYDSWLAVAVVLHSFLQVSVSTPFLRQNLSWK